MESDPILRHIHGPMQRVEGWFTRLDAEIAAAIAHHQTDMNVTESIGEIGVHHGRMFGALALALKDGERAFAIDVFDEQHLNRDRSVHGDGRIFRDNLARNGIDESRIDIIRGTSLSLDWTAIGTKVGAPARLFSIDGGHAAAVLEHDLEVAETGWATPGS